MKKKMFSLVLVLVLVTSTVTASPADYLYTCPTCHVTSNTLNGPHVPSHDGILHIKLAWKAFTNWWNSVSTPFDLNG
jgi:hypothetical protein